MDEVFNKLYKTADDLALDCMPPIEIGGLCGRLGIHVTKTPSSRPGLKRAFLVQTNEATKIILPQSGSGTNDFTAWERFLVAHELGHFFLSQLKVPKPLGAREYWNIEKVCDGFARHLLLPAREVTAVVSNSGGSAVSLLDATLHLRTRWCVPWPVAAYEVTDTTKRIYFLKLIVDKDRFRVSTSTLPNNQHIGRLIAATSLFGSLLLKLPTNEHKSNQLTVESFVDLEFLRDASEAAACRLGHNQYLVAALHS